MMDYGESLSNSSSESSGDEEVDNRKKVKIYNYYEKTVPHLTEEEFMERFRVSLHIYQSLTERFEQSSYYNYHSGGNGKICARKQVAIFLWFAGHRTESFRAVAKRFGITISSLFTIIRRLMYFVSNLAPQIIKWPNRQEQMQIERNFRQKGFPGVVGVIDGTHIKLDKPKIDPDNRNKKFFIQLQLVCDDERRIRDLFVGYPGSVHDSRVLRTTPLHNTLAKKCGGFYLLGDSGYPCLSHLLTPFKDRGNLTRRQKNYNEKLVKCHYIIEDCNRILKQKWRQLFHIKLRKACDIIHFIRACCVLHNLALENDCTVDEKDPLFLLPNPDEAIFDQDNAEFEDAAADDRTGDELRNHVANILPM